MRDDDLPCPTRRHGNAGDIYDFNDDIIPIGCSYWARIVETAMPA